MRRIRANLRDGWFVTPDYVATRYWAVPREFSEEMVLPPMHGGKRISFDQTHHHLNPWSNESPDEAESPIGEGDERATGRVKYIHYFTRRNFAAPVYYARGDRLAVNQSWHYQMMRWADEVRITRCRAVYYRGGKVVGIIMGIVEKPTA